MAHDPKFIELVQATLNIRHLSQLEIEIPIDRSNGVRRIFDLADSKGKVFVEVINNITPNRRGDIGKKIEEISSFIIDPNKILGKTRLLIFVFEEEISETERKFYTSRYSRNNQINYEFLDRRNIFDFGVSFKSELPAYLQDYLEYRDKNHIDLFKYSTSNIEKGLSFENPIVSWDTNFGEKSERFFREFSGDFWWINITEESFSITELSIGKIYKYPIFNEKGKRRYLREFETNDIAMSYQIAPKQRLAGVFKVVSIDSEYVHLLLCHELKTKLSWNELNFIPEFRNSEIAKMKAVGSAYPLDRDLFILLLEKSTLLFELENDLVTVVDNFKSRNKDFFINGDWIDNDTSSENRKIINIPRSEPIATDHGDKDSLNFEKDAQSLAALIALKEMKPPIAIALFGNWGSGKSFFMNAIERRIRELSKYQGFVTNATNYGNIQEPEEELFHRGIAHIRFNAWSYMDANLWAGLANSLFEKLNEYINDNTKSEEERLKVKSKISKRLELLGGDLNDYKKKLNDLEQLKKELEHDRDNEILTRIRKNEYDKEVLELFKDLGLDNEIVNSFLPSKIYKYVTKGANLLSFIKANSYRFLYTILVSIALIFIFKIIVEPLIPNLMVLKSIWTYISIPVLTTIIPSVKFLRKRKTLLRKIVDLVDIENNLKSNETNEVKLDFAINEIDRINGQILEVEKNIQQEKENQSNLTELAIKNFIINKPHDVEYKKHLGIITTIRKDFETLSDLFAEKDKAIDDTFNEKEIQRIIELNKDRAEIQEAFNGLNTRKLDRIVLYIDDLDRCDDSKVLQVLQAVHLLMAFPLFIVIVGVDERCVHNALMYKQLRRYKNMHPSTFKEHINYIEPREYLEKIFQIPFQLPIASGNGIERLIDDIVPNTIDNKVNIQEEEKIKLGQDFLGNFNFGEDGKRAEESNGNIEMDYDVNMEAFENQWKDQAIKPEVIRITDMEKDYLKKFAPLVGTNPRTIKRYVNIFRIVKTHEQGLFTSNENTVKIVFLLAMFLGENRKSAFEILKTNKDESIGKILSSDHREVLKLIERYRSIDELITNLLILKPTDFKESLKFIERFSYNIPSQTIMYGNLESRD